ncbi:MAG: hypothetical protein KKB51_10745 [Candidatus Riflebacteria bacterium]|nr:hypothetical protein [Candidatus Riflebacteria bacterium]
MKYSFLLSFFFFLGAQCGTAQVLPSFEDFISNFKKDFQINLVLNSQTNKPPFNRNDFSSYRSVPYFSNGIIVWAKIHKSPEIPGDMVESVKCFGDATTGIIQVLLSKRGEEIWSSLIKHSPNEKIIYLYKRKVIQEQNTNDVNLNSYISLKVKIRRDFNEFSHLFFPISLIEKAYNYAVKNE